MGEAFKPLGVYIDFFQPSLPAGTNRTFTVMLVNDEHRPVEGALSLVLESARGRELARAEHRFAMQELGDARLELTLEIPPAASGPCLLKAVARADGARSGETTLSRRRVEIENAGR